MVRLREESIEIDRQGGIETQRRVPGPGEALPSQDRFFFLGPRFQEGIGPRPGPQFSPKQFPEEPRVDPSPEPSPSVTE
jgi:hypothetical protein